jgi:RND family efflux transporter MFP subunit
VGSLKASKEARILAQSAGRVLSLNAELGKHVGKGQQVATIDNNLQELNILTASNNLAKAEADLARYKQLFDGGAATEQKYLEVQITTKNAQTALDQAKKQFYDSNVKAPFAGILISKDVEEGSYVNIGNLIATIIDISSLKVLVSVPENRIYQIETGQQVSLTADVTPGQTYTGNITYISPKGDESHNYAVEIMLQNNHAVQLKAGTFVTANFRTKTKGIVQVIPRKSLLTGTTDGKVFTINNSLAEFKKVTVVREAGDSVEITGLSTGQTVVTTGQLNLKEGSKVTVIK